MAAEKAAGAAVGSGGLAGGVGGLDLVGDGDLLARPRANADGGRAARADGAGLDGELNGGAGDAGGGEGGMFV